MKSPTCLWIFLSALSCRLHSGQQMFSATRIDKFDVEDKVETPEPVDLVVKQPTRRQLYCDARFGICILRERSDRKVIFSWEKTRVEECEKRNSMEHTYEFGVQEVHLPNALFWVFVAETKKNVNPLKKQATNINKGTIAEVAEEEEHKEGLQFTIDRRSDEGSRRILFLPLMAENKSIEVVGAERFLNYKESYGLDLSVGDFFLSGSSSDEAEPKCKVRISFQVLYAYME
ncbi:hypothetical protein Tco_0909845 [Tanacetum coccineum]|uniref:Uncharacterized protein n=1 Tax=Tanacetum coccineum TaxID=301880 RepID=A0ABQ5CRB2_9ASTR